MKITTSIQNTIYKYQIKKYVTFTNTLTPNLGAHPSSGNFKTDQINFSLAFFPPC